MFDPVDVHVGNRIRLRRISETMSQKELGRKLGVTFQQIQKYEKGINRIGAGRLFRIARALKVPVAYFFEDIAPAPQPLIGQIGESPSPFTHNMSDDSGLQSQYREEARKLLQVFDQILDPQIRTQIIELAQTLSKNSKKTP